MKLAVLSDFHYCDSAPSGTRRGDLADILMQRAVYRINRLIRPDLTVFLGDLLDRGDLPEAAGLRSRLMAIARKIETPLLLIPGNHDGDIEDFYRDFPRTTPWLDLNGYRLVPFLDAEEPGYNARRSNDDLQRMRDARAAFNGPIIQLQHTALFPSGAHACPYNYVNIEAVLETMRAAGITLSISGHYHPGIDPITTETGTFIGAPALCEAPFSLMEIALDDDRATVTRHPLQMPPALGLTDLHIHTPLAYCSENMDVARTLELAPLFGLSALAFAEHSGHLYYAAEDYWGGRFLDRDTERAPLADERMAAYLAYHAGRTANVRVALETDCDFRGRPVLRARDRDRVDFLVGAIHTLPTLRDGDQDPERAAKEFMAVLSTFVHSGIAVLAHPFRVFRRAKLPVPDRLFDPVVALLNAAGVAAEINFHCNEPDPDFFARCLQAGVRLTFGSDAHNLAEIGDFALHLHLLEQCGIRDGDLGEVLLPWPPYRRGP